MGVVGCQAGRGVAGRLVAVGVLGYRSVSAVKRSRESSIGSVDFGGPWVGRVGVVWL